MLWALMGIGITLVGIVATLCLQSRDVARIRRDVSLIAIAMQNAGLLENEGSRTTIARDKKGNLSGVGVAIRVPPVSAGTGVKAPKVIQAPPAEAP